MPDNARFELRLTDNLLQLEEELRDRTHRPGAYHTCYFPGDDLFVTNRARELPIGNLPILGDASAHRRAL
jgi:hypothetical protein